jgi:hypothetical protein
MLGQQLLASTNVSKSYCRTNESGNSFKKRNLATIQIHHLVHVACSFLLSPFVIKGCFLCDSTGTHTPGGGLESPWIASATARPNRRGHDNAGGAGRSISALCTEGSFVREPLVLDVASSLS